MKPIVGTLGYGFAHGQEHRSCRRVLARVEDQVISSIRFCRQTYCYLSGVHQNG
jgi:hypothetical protein